MTGFTRDEEILAAFGDASFLHMWTWPNLFRNQGKTSASSDGKEICDLTVIFGNTVILFSDKRIEFNLDTPLEVSWSRWVRKAVYASMKQLIGAERWIKTNPNQIFTDKKCTKRIPMSLPPPNDIKFIRIVVAHGIEKIAQVKDNDGSLSFTNELQGENNCRPFILGLISETKFVHVFTGDSIEYVLSEFDTAEDFISYLMEREELFLLNKEINVSKESDIIHLYYENYSNERQTRVILSAPELLENTVSITKEPIEMLYSSSRYSAKKKADQVSYFWDKLINIFASHVLNDSLAYQNRKDISEIEPILRLMANHNRLRRRILSNTFAGFYHNTIPGQGGTRVIYDTSEPPSVGYLFLLMPYIENQATLKEYRKKRITMLEVYAWIYSDIMYSKVSSLIGIAAMTRTSEGHISDDFFKEGQDHIYLECKKFDQNTKATAQNIRMEYEKSGRFAKITASSVIGYKFPQ